MRLLAHRPRSEAEVRRLLERRFAAPLVDQVVQRLKEQRLLDDAAFAGQWRQSREQRRPRARGMVKQELRRMGVAPEVAEAALQGFDDEANAYQAGLRLVRRLAGAGEAEFWRRVVEHLQRRGFGRALAARTAARLRAGLADPLHRDEDAHDDEQQAPDVKPKMPRQPAD